MEYFVGMMTNYRNKSLIRILVKDWSVARLHNYFTAALRILLVLRLNINISTEDLRANPLFSKSVHFSS